jgi:hypothetical protein
MSGHLDALRYCATGRTTAFIDDASLSQLPVRWTKPRACRGEDHGFNTPLDSPRVPPLSIRTLVYHSVPRPEPERNDDLGGGFAHRGLKHMKIAEAALRPIVHRHLSLVGPGMWAPAEN